MRHSPWFFAVIISLMLVTPIFAQITINSNDYNPAIGSQHYLYYLTDFTGVGFTVDLGSTGGPQTWNFDFQKFPNGNGVIFTIVTPASTPYGASYPTSDHCWFAADFHDSTKNYNYFDHTSSALYANGTAIAKGDSDLVLVYDPPQKYLPFPATLNTQWTNTNVTEFGSPGLFMIVDSSVSDLKVDAWGTITIPNASYECLRVREDITCYTETYVMGTRISYDSTKYYQYQWYAKDVGFVAQVISFFDETNPNFTKAEDISFRTTSPVSVEEKDGHLVAQYRLFQNYPNPFNPETTIGFDLPRSAHVNITLYDVKGREIATLLDAVRPAGYNSLHFDGSGLASGVYLYKLQTDLFTDVRKMVIAK